MRTRNTPYTTGETTRLTPPPHAEWAHITAPNGQQLKIRKHNNTITIWLAQPGTWTIQWEGHPTQTLEVVSPPAPPSGPPPPTPAPRRWNLTRP